MEAERKLVPNQKVGARTGATQKKEQPTRHEAILLFKEAKKRLLDVNNWSALCGKVTARFQLCDASGDVLVNQVAKVGNCIRITLPAPANNTGDGFDWVMIEEFLDSQDLIKDEEVFGFRVRPVQNPRSGSESSAHFYSSKATSSFLVVRHTNVVTVMERGRNEMPNIGPRRFLNKIRNAMIALGAMLGLSSAQWKALVNGILNGPPEE